MPRAQPGDLQEQLIRLVGRLDRATSDAGLGTRTHRQTDELLDRIAAIGEDLITAARGERKPVNAPLGRIGTALVF